MRRRSLFISAITLTSAAGLCAALVVPAQAAVIPPGVGAPVGAEASIIRTAMTTKVPYEPEGSLASYQPAPQTLGPELTQFEAANAAIGYGNLAPDGVTTIEAIAKRMYDRLPSLFNGASGDLGGGVGRPVLDHVPGGGAGAVPYWSL
jgi:hypothetical protein